MTGPFPRVDRCDRPAKGSAPQPHDIADLRSRLAQGSGPALWRSLEAVAETPAFRDFLAKEFPSAARLADGPDRRQFFRLMAASFAFAGLSACSDEGNPRNHEVPYVRNPERILPGAPLVYTSATLLDGLANGATVLTRDGRPLKVEGNDRHPWSRGGSDIFAQASILDLYDPSRSQAGPLPGPDLIVGRLPRRHGGPRRGPQGGWRRRPAAADRAGEFADPAGPDRGAQAILPADAVA